VTVIAATSAPSATASAQRWPLFIAPIVGLVYYLAMRNAFITAIGDVVLDTSDLDITPDAAPTKWATHWIYHLIAEAVSVAFGAFLSGGMARDRAAMAGLIGGFGISLAWTAYLAIILFGHYSLPGFDDQLVEPWYQYLVSGSLAVAAPVIGYLIGDATREFVTEKPTGLAGIPRAHFLWLWIPAYWYSAAMIPSVLKIYTNGLLEWVSPFKIMFLFLVPLACFSWALIGGLSLLSTEIGIKRPILKQTLGVLVLVIGWYVAFAIHYGIISIANRL
jgi:hypothetical protein